MAQSLKYGTYYSAQKNGPNLPIQKILIVGVIAAVLIGGGLLALNLLSGHSKQDLTLLAVHENSLLTLANSSRNSIRNADLSTANSNATILLTSDVANLVAVTGIKKLPDDLVKKEADTHGDALKQATLLNKFDTTYKDIAVEKIEALLTEAQALRGSITGKKMLAALDQVIANLQAIDKQFVQLKL